MSKTTLYVPTGTGPYTVDGAEYEVVDGKIEVAVPHHVDTLKILGASETPLDRQPVFGERIPSEFGPTQEEHDNLRAQRDALALENENLIKQGDALALENENLIKQGDADAAGIQLIATVFTSLSIPIGETENIYDAAARVIREQHELLAATTAPAGGVDAPGDTSGSLGGAAALADPGFTKDSDYQEIVNWLKANGPDNGVVVPGNISKDNALNAVTEVLAKANKSA